MVEVVVEEEEEEVLVMTKKEVGLPNHVCVYIYIHVSGVKGKMSHGEGGSRGWNMLAKTAGNNMD